VRGGARPCSRVARAGRRRRRQSAQEGPRESVSSAGLQSQTRQADDPCSLRRGVSTPHALYSNSRCSSPTHPRPAPAQSPGASMQDSARSAPPRGRTSAARRVSRMSALSVRSSRRYSALPPTRASEGTCHFRCASSVLVLRSHLDVNMRYGSVTPLRRSSISTCRVHTAQEVSAAARAQRTRRPPRITHDQKTQSGPPRDRSAPQCRPRRAPARTSPLPRARRGRRWRRP
jgi:hypothetical protein